MVSTKWFTCVLVCKLHYVLLPNLLRSDLNFVAWIEDKISEKSCKPGGIPTKSHTTNFMTSSVDPIYQKVSSVKIPTDM